jgi:hypothetical protein
MDYVLILFYNNRRKIENNFSRGIMGVFKGNPYGCEERIVNTIL